jgi:flagellar hook-associated protein 3 FlgL
MRITQQMMANNLSRSLSQHTEKLMKAQSAVSSGKQITTASDDPVGMSHVLDYRKTLASIDQYSRNITQANTGLNLADTTLSDIQALLNQAKSLAIEQANGTYNADDKKTVAGQLQQIRDQIIQLANTKNGNQYLFGGRNTVTPPYDSEHPETATFNGDDSQNQILISDNVKLDVHVSGKQAFDGTIAGTADPVVVLTTLIDGLNANDSSAAASSLDPLDQCMAQVSDTQAAVGITLNHLDATETHLSDLKLSFQAMLSNTEDADLTKTITDLTAQQSAYDASLAVTAKIIQHSLLDYLS